MSAPPHVQARIQELNEDAYYKILRVIFFNDQTRDTAVTKILVGLRSTLNINMMQHASWTRELMAAKSNGTLGYSQGPHQVQQPQMQSMPMMSLSVPDSYHAPGMGSSKGAPKGARVGAGAMPVANPKGPKHKRIRDTEDEAYGFEDLGYPQQGAPGQYQQPHQAVPDSQETAMVGYKVKHFKEDEGRMVEGVITNYYDGRIEVTYRWRTPHASAVWVKWERSDALQMLNDRAW